MSSADTLDVAATLTQTEFFNMFPASALRHLEQVATRRKFKKNTLVIVAGDESLALYVLLEGGAYAFTDDDEGNEFIVSTFVPGDCFGELGLLDDQSRTANVITTHACHCLVIPKAEIQRVIASEPRVAQAVIHNLVGRIRNMTEDVSCLALMDVYGRLVRVLNQSAEPQSNGDRVTDRFTHQELASRIGSSREMVSKILKELRTGGYISIQNNCIHIHRNLPERW